MCYDFSQRQFYFCSPCVFFLDKEELCRFPLRLLMNLFDLTGITIFSLHYNFFLRKDKRLGIIITSIFWLAFVKKWNDESKSYEMHLYARNEKWTLSVHLLNMHVQTNPYIGQFLVSLKTKAINEARESDIWRISQLSTSVPFDEVLLTLWVIEVTRFCLIQSLSSLSKNF